MAEVAGELRQSQAHAAGAFEALLALGRRRALHQRDQAFGQAWHQLAQVAHTPGLDGRHDDLRVVAIGRTATGQHLEQDHTQRVDVRAMIGGLRRHQLLGRHVLWGTHHHASAG